MEVVQETRPLCFSKDARESARESRSKVAGALGTDYR